MPPSLGTHKSLCCPALHRAGPGEMQSMLRSGQMGGIKEGFCLWQNFLHRCLIQTEAETFSERETLPEISDEGQYIAQLHGKICTNDAFYHKIHDNT